MDFSSLTPSDLGLPEKFSSFRKIQLEGMQYGLYGPFGQSAVVSDPSILRRFRCMSLAPGSGKSLSTHAIGVLSGVKYVVLTATRSLEEQQVKDKFACFNIKGKANYSCLHIDEEHPLDRYTCAEGFEKGCVCSGTKRCSYGAAVDEAKNATAILTNYQYWMNTRGRYPGALEGTQGGQIGLIIADEAHKIGNEISRFLSMSVSLEELYRWAEDDIRRVIRNAKGEEWGRVTDEWIAVLQIVYGRMLERMEIILLKYFDPGVSEAAAERMALKNSPEYRRLSRTSDDLERIATLGTDRNWVWKFDRRHGGKAGIAFECVWPGRYAERYLWSNVPRVVLMSGTLKAKAMDIMNVRPKDYHFKEWGRVFPAANCPVYWLPTGRMGYKTDREEVERSVAAFDNIFEVWRRYRGVVHTHSYERAKWLRDKSKYGRYMILNEAGEQQSKFEEFCARPEENNVLVSPSYTTGVDMAGPICRWQHIIKLPFPSRGDPIMQARCADDEQYYNYETMQTFVQTCFRPQRDEKDWGVNFVTDDAVRNFRNYARMHAPGYFKVTEVDHVVTPEELGRGLVGGARL